MNGVDPYIHDGKPRGLLRELTNAFARPAGQTPGLQDLERVYRDLMRIGAALKAEGSLFQSRAFRELVVAAQELSGRHKLFA